MTVNKLTKSAYPFVSITARIQTTGNARIALLSLGLKHHSHPVAYASHTRDAATLITKPVQFITHLEDHSFTRSAKPTYANSGGISAEKPASTSHC